MTNVFECISNIVYALWQFYSSSQESLLLLSILAISLRIVSLQGAYVLQVPPN